MDFAIRLSCVLAVMCCLASTGNAEPSDQDRQRLLELQAMSKRNNNLNAQVAITYETVQIYKKYRGKEGRDVAMENDINTEVEEFESHIEVVEGLPIQGWSLSGWLKNDLQKEENSKTIKAVTKMTTYLLNKFAKKFG